MWDKMIFEKKYKFEAELIVGVTAKGKELKMVTIKIKEPKKEYLVYMNDKDYQSLLFAGREM